MRTPRASWAAGFVDTPRGTRAAGFLAGSLVLLLPLIGCGERERAEATALAGLGAETASLLADHYDALADATLDVLETETFLAGLRDVPLDEAQRARLDRRADGLAARARLARRLAAAYGSLARLADADPRPAAEVAATDLAGAIADLGSTGEAAAEPAGLFGSLAADLLAWRQAKDLEDGAALLRRSLSGAIALYDAETGLYDDVIEERRNKAAAVADHLIRNEMVVALPLMESVPGALGLKWSSTSRAVRDPATVEALVAVAAVRLERQALAARRSGAGVRDALVALEAGHEALEAGRPADLEGATRALARARTWLETLVALTSDPDAGGDGG